MSEEKAIGSKVLDSSVWLVYILKNLHSEIIDSGEPLSISILSLFEIRKKLLRDGILSDDIDTALSLIKKRSSLILPVTEIIAERAAFLSVEHKIPALDALIYATARAHRATLITRDNDFRNLEGVEIL